MNKKKILTTIIVTFLVLAALVGALVVYDRQGGGDRADDITVEDAQALVDETFDSLPLQVIAGLQYPNDYIIENSSVTVKELSYGHGKTITLVCEYETIDAFAVYSAHKDEIWTKILDKYTDKDVSTKISLALRSLMMGYLQNEAEVKRGEVELLLCQTIDGFRLYLSDETVNTCLGSVLSIHEDIEKMTVTADGVDISRYANFRNAFIGLFGLANYDSERPDTSGPVTRMWNDFCADFHKNFIKDARWQYLTEGLWTTLKMTAGAILIGIVIGFLVAVIRATYLKTKKLLPLDLVCRLYLTVIRGTPLMVQLLIIYFVLLLPIGIPKFWAAILCFGFNSGAYVAEIIRGGIMAVDEGQSEAGRSLGFNYVQTMVFIVIPQAFKSTLPALANEFIVLLKESSVAFYIGVADLTQGGLKIRSLTYSDFLPLIAVALIYLVVVVILTNLVSLLERRLRKSDR